MKANEKMQSRRKELLEAFQKDESFFSAAYDAEQHLGNLLILDMVQTVGANSAPAYHMAKAFSLKAGQPFFENQRLFPLRHFVTEKGYGDPYIKQLATGGSAADSSYAAECRKHGSGTRQKPKNAKANRVERIKGRYTQTTNDDKIREGVLPFDWKFLQYTMQHLVATGEEQRNGRQKDLVSNIDNLSDHLDLDASDGMIFKYLIAYEHSTHFNAWMDAMSDQKDGQTAFMALAAGVTVEEFSKRIGPNGALTRKGLLRVPEEAEGADAEENRFPKISSNVYNTLKKSSGSEEDYISQICGEQHKTEYSLKDFPHLGKDIEYALKILRDGLKNKRQGVHILVSGETGVGKTTVATALGNKAAQRVYRPCENDNKVESEESDDINTLNAALAMVKGSINTIIGYENLQKLVGDGLEASESAIKLDRLLQNNSVPMIWTIEDHRSLGPALVSRFSYHINVPQPPAEVRAKMFEKGAQRIGRTIDSEDAFRLGQRFVASPAIIRKTVELESALNGNNSKNSKVNPKNIEAIMDNTGKALHGMKTSFRQNAIPLPYNMGLVNATLNGAPFNLIELMDDLEGTIHPVQVLIHGPSGAGKSAFIRYFAHKTVKKEVVEKQFSELSDKWHGESEKRVDAAFEDARINDYMLQIDEADSLLAKRIPQADSSTGNVHNTLTNQVLTSMEKSNASVAMTTNFVESLDPACFRRFMYVIQMGYLKPEQVAPCYEQFFGRELPKNNKLSSSSLGAGDFAAVRKAFVAQGSKMTDDKLQAYVLSIANIRKNEGRTVIQGFRRPAIL